MSKTTKILVLLGLGAVAVWLLARKSYAATSQPQASGAARTIAIGSAVAGLIAKGAAAVKSVLGIGGTAAATAGGAGAATAGAGVAVTSAGTAAGAAGASATASGVTAGTGAASAGVGSALAPAGGLAAAGAVMLLALAPVLNLFGWFGKEPEWHKEFRESGDLAKWEATYAAANVQQAAQIGQALPAGTFAAKSLVPPEDMGGPYVRSAGDY